MKDALGDRMKMYEQVEAGRRLLPMVPALARIDGRCFSKFTHGLARPFDARLSELMVRTTEYLVEESVAVCGYTQSDEISLVWLQTSSESEIFFSGRIQKMVSQLAAMASAFFIRELPKALPEVADRLPTFDARVWNVPNKDEAANTFLWRELDAAKNSISMAARHYFSHKQLHGKHGNEMQEMLWQKGVNWNDYPGFFKRGTFVQRRTVVRKFTTEEWERLPEKHEARLNPDLEIERSQVVRLEMPPFRSVKNRVGVIFSGEEPITSEASHAG